MGHWILLPGSVHVHHRPLAHECLVSWLERHRCLGFPLCVDMLCFLLKKNCNAWKNFTLTLPETLSGVEVTFPDRGTFLGCFYTKETNGCCDCLQSWKGEQVHRISGLRSWNVLIYNVWFIAFYHGMFLNQCTFILNVSIMFAKMCKDVPQTDNSHMHKFDCGVYEHHVKIWSKPRVTLP